MKLLDLKQIKEEDIYTGNINLITTVDKEMLEEIKKCDIVLGDYSPACKTILAKENALLIKVNDLYYIDIDSIKSNKDIENINTLISSNSKNNNILLRHGTFNPFVGGLYISNLRCAKENTLEEVTLRLKNTQK